MWLNAKIHFCNVVNGYFLQLLFLSIYSSLCFPTSLALIAKFQHPPCCPGGPEQHLFPNLWQSHGDLVAPFTVSTLPFPEPWILTGSPVQLPSFQAPPYYILLVMLSNLACSRKEGRGQTTSSHTLCRSRWKQRHFQTGPSKIERRAKQHVWQMLSYWKCENPALV